jgi:hypothetical protein
VSKEKNMVTMGTVCEEGCQMGKELVKKFKRRALKRQKCLERTTATESIQSHTVQ